MMRCYALSTKDTKMLHHAIYPKKANTATEHTEIQAVLRHPRTRWVSSLSALTSWFSSVNSVLSVANCFFKFISFRAFRVFRVFRGQPSPMMSPPR